MQHKYTCLYHLNVFKECRIWQVQKMSTVYSLQVDTSVRKDAHQMLDLSTIYSSTGKCISPLVIGIHDTS